MFLPLSCEVNNQVIAHMFCKTLQHQLPPSLALLFVLGAINQSLLVPMPAVENGVSQLHDPQEQRLC